MESDPYPYAVPHYQLHFLVVPPVCRASGAFDVDEPPPASARLATESANEISRRGPPSSPACYHCAPVSPQLRHRLFHSR